MRKPMSEVLHASLKDQPVLLSISRDPSSTLKINKCLSTILFKKYKDERREILPTHGGEACKSIGVLTKLAGNGEMFVFLCDFTRVLSRSTGSRSTLEMKTHTLKIFN